MVPTTLNWKLMDRDPLETWVHKDGTLVLLGDSCHPMLVRLIVSVIVSTDFIRTLSRIALKDLPWLLSDLIRRGSTAY